MEMMQCPQCGARNSVRREYCFECKGGLRGEPKEAPDSAPTCAICSHAAIFPPPGQRLTPDQVWCTKKGEALASAKVADNCFSQAFGWNRAEILD
jgi:ribosomal protein L40E